MEVVDFDSIDFYEYEHNKIIELLDSLKAFRKQEKTRILQECKTISGTNGTQDWKDDYFEIQGEQLSLLRNIIELAQGQCVVSLWSNVEINSKEIAEKFFAGIGSEKNSYKFKTFKKLLKKKGVFPEKLSSFKTVDELRCLNNCIKHSGVVDKKLAVYKGWIKDKEIDFRNTSRLFKRASKEAHLYLQDLKKECKEKTNIANDQKRDILSLVKNILSIGFKIISQFFKKVKRTEKKGNL